MSKKNNRKKRREQLNSKKNYKTVNESTAQHTVSKVDSKVKVEEAVQINIEDETNEKHQGSFKETIIHIPENNLSEEENTYTKKIKPILKKLGTPICRKLQPVKKKVARFFEPICSKVKKTLKPVNDRLSTFFAPLRKRCKKIWNSKNMLFIRKYVRQKWNVLKVWLNKVYGHMLTKPFRTSLILGLFSIIFIEAMSRRSFADAIIFICEKPLIFLMNYLIVLSPFLLAIAIRRKTVVYLFFSVLWILVGLTDFLLLTHRTTPFTGVDLKIDRNEITVIFEYLNDFESFLIIMAIVITIILLAMLMVFSKKTECRFGRVKSSIIVVALWCVIYFSVIFSINTGLLSTKFGNLGISYHEYGMPYCFLVTIVDTGIAKPKDYSEEKMDNLVSSVPSKEPITTVEKTTKNIDELPNIIFIQLESFIDPTLIKNGVEFSEDPMPFYRSLREQYSSGYLTVPTVVAGTCNTEFEVITGMSLDFFGPGEYPYKTILKDTTCESMAYDLKNIGYTAHAIHNHTSGFYGRNMIYSHFGFDSFTGIEMMHDVSRTANGNWAKDDVLTGCILDSLNSSEGKDLVYTVSVQCHGTYNSDLPEEEKVIEVTGIDDPDLLQSYTYYVNQVKQVDNFVKELVTELSEYDEDVVLVMYGDHIPGLGLSDSMFEDITTYETEYVVWNNMGLEKKDMNLTSYQLAGEVFDRVGIYEGTIFKYHQDTDKNSKDYLSGLEYLQYDMLYGQHYVYSGENPFEATDIRYGVKDIVIEKATYDGEYLYVSSADKCFSKYSKLFINGERKKTEVIFSDMLRVKVDPEDIPDGSILTVHQINSLNAEFHCSPEYVYTNGEYIFDEDVYDEILDEGSTDVNDESQVDLNDLQ